MDRGGLGLNPRLEAPLARLAPPFDILAIHEPSLGQETNLAACETKRAAYPINTTSRPIGSWIRGHAQRETRHKRQTVYEQSNPKVPDERGEAPGRRLPAAVSVA